MQNSVVLLIPELNQENKYFLFHNYNVITLKSITVSGYKIYAVVEYLCMYTAPFTVVAVPSSNSSAKFYPIYYTSDIKELEKHGFSLDESPYGLVVNFGYEKFLNFISEQECVDVSSIPFEEQRLKCASLIGLYRITIIPSVSKIIFQDNFDLDVYHCQARELYFDNDNLPALLTDIFKQMFYALSIFGFCETDDEITKQKINDIEKAVDENEIFFPFSDIIFAITKFNMLCYKIPKHRSSTITSGNFFQLRDSLYVVERFLKHIGYEFEVNRYKSVKNAIILFQKNNNLKKTGICDERTLKEIWKACLLNSPRIYDIANFIGFIPAKNYRNDTILVEKLENDNEVQGKLVDKINCMISNLPNSEIPEEYLRSLILKKFLKLSQKCVVLSERISGTAERLNYITNALRGISTVNQRSRNAINNAYSALGAVSKDHSIIQHQYRDIRRRITSQQNQSVIFTAIGIIIFLFFIKKYL